MAFENGIIDLRSDTVTKPTLEMRQAMAGAEVGDDVYGEDPTVNRLQEQSAAILGKEEGLFVASGTMANLVAVLTHCGRGDEAIMGRQGHTFLHEVGGISALGGIFPNVIPNQPDGTLAIEDIENAYREEDIHHPQSRLLILENTQNQCGGLPISAEYMNSAGDLAHELGMALHVDGARIFNAAIALDVTASKLVDSADSVMFCLSKGLGAPVGSVLCGSKRFIKEAKRIRKQLGGGMRQAGIIAAAGLVSLNTMIKRLDEDHIHAAQIADGLKEIKGIGFDKGMPKTNMVFLKLTREVTMSPGEIISKLKDRKILIGQSGKRNFRLVTHNWINDVDIPQIIQGFREVFS